MPHIITRGLSVSTIFSTVSHKWHDFLKVEGKVCFDFKYKFFCNTSHSKKN